MKNLFIYAIILMGFVYGNEDFENDETEDEYIGNEEDFELIDSLVVEEPCAKQGGSCVIAADCLEGRLTEEKGLCPKQQAKGVECCYGFSVKETRCYKYGGMCKSEKDHCKPELVLEAATDCPEHQNCCIMV